MMSCKNFALEEIITIQQACNDIITNDCRYGKTELWSKSKGLAKLIPVVDISINWA